MKDSDLFLEEPFVSRWPVPWWGWVLAGVGAVLAIAGTVRMLQPQMDERLYARYRKLPTAAFVPAGDSCCADLVEAAALYNQKKYTKALAQFDRCSTQLFADESRLFKGICYLELNEMKQAEMALAPLLGQHSRNGDEAEWYTALSRLRRHDRKGCIAILTTMTSENPRYPQAQQLLQRSLK